MENGKWKMEKAIESRSSSFESREGNFHSVILLNYEIVIFYIVHLFTEL